MQVKNLKAFQEALTALEVEKGIDRHFIIDALKEAVGAAYKKTHGMDLNIEVDIDEDFDITINLVKTVVEEIEDEDLEILLKDAKKIDAEASLGDEILLEEKSEEFRRNAIQNAKQMVIQKIREAEKEGLLDKFEGKRNRISTGTIRRINPSGDVFLDLEGTETILSPREQSAKDNYRVGTTLKVCVVDIISLAKMPKVIISRRTPKLVEELFRFEVPEIAEDIVKIKSISRDAGFRTKIAVSSDSEAIDPVGACVGHKGMRIKAITDELQGEKIDIVIWDPELKTFINNALKPAVIEDIDIVEDENGIVANVKVKEDQLALAIGKKGQNARLAARLTQAKINIEVEEE